MRILASQRPSGKSDREICAHAQVNSAFRYFLGFGLTDALPHPRSLTVFRARLGADIYQQIFDSVVSQARAAGLVKDRLRLKDATHVLANIAVPATMRLVAQLRQRLLAVAEPFASAAVAAERAHAAAIHTATGDLGDAERLVQRVAQLRQIVTWADGVAHDLGPPPADLADPHRAFTDTLALAHQILADRDGTNGGDQVVSLHDSDARRGNHGGFFTGYLLDVAMDADSQLITALAVLPANGDEATAATALIRHEERVHGNDVATLSIAKAGFRGALRRAWQDPTDLALTVVVPPVREDPPPHFTAIDFHHDAVRGTLTYPGGCSTPRRTRNHVDTGWKYTFPRSTGGACPLQAQCVYKLPTTTGRMVVINDYAVEYAAARQYATTADYRQIRREHPAIERKLADMIRHHGGRVARYWGQARVCIQYLLLGLVVNVKRMVRLLVPAPPRPGRPRPVVRGSGLKHPLNDRVNPNRGR